MSGFYFGGDTGAEGSVARSGGLKKMVGANLEEIDAREINSIRLFDDAEGREVHVRVGRFGPYLERMVQNAGRSRRRSDLAARQPARRPAAGRAHARVRREAVRDPAGGSQARASIR